MQQASGGEAGSRHEPPGFTNVQGRHPAPRPSLARRSVAAGLLVLSVLAGIGDPITSLAREVPWDSTFEDWQGAFDFPPGAEVATADPDGDGLSNLIEYALGTDPMAAERVGHPAATTIMALGVSYPAISFRRNPNPSDLAVRVRASSSVRFDDDLGTSEVRADMGEDGAELVVVRSVVPSSGRPAQFLRLEIEWKPGGATGGGGDEGADDDFTETAVFVARPDLDLAALPMPSESEYVALARSVLGTVGSMVGAGGVSILETVLGGDASSTGGSDVGIVLGMGGKGAAALYALARAALADPQDATTASNLAVGLNQTGRYAEGWTAIRWAERLFPTNALIQANKGWLALNLGDYPNAEVAFEAAASSDSGLMSAHDGRGLALMARGQPRLALAAARASLANGFSGCGGAIFENAAEALRKAGTALTDDEDLPGTREGLRAAGGGGVAPLPELGVPPWSGQPAEIAERALDISAWVLGYQDFLAREQQRISGEVLQLSLARPTQRPWVAYSTKVGGVITQWRGYDRDLFSVDALGKRTLRLAGDAFGRYSRESVGILQQLMAELDEVRKAAGEEEAWIEANVPSEQRSAALEASRIKWLRQARARITERHTMFTAATQGYWARLGNLIVEFAGFSAPFIEDIADENANRYANLARTQTILIVEGMRLATPATEWASQVTQGWRTWETLPDQDTYQPTVNLGKPVLKVWPVDPRKSVLPTIHANFGVGALEADDEKVKLEFYFLKFGVAGGEVKFGDDWSKNQWTAFAGLKADLKFGPFGGAISDRVGSAKILLAATYAEGAPIDYGLQSSLESRIDLGMGKLGGPEGIDVGGRVGFKAEGRWMAAAGPGVKVTPVTKITFK